ncbi:MAG: SLOG family protein [Microcystaceae cyanobacterium]
MKQYEPRLSAFFTGHRDYKNLEEGIDSLINYAISRNIIHFYCGMALGADLTAAQLLCDRQLKWTAVIPFLGQTNRWKKAEKSLYEKLMPQAIERTTLYRDYCQQAYHARNEYMIEKSKLCLAIYDGRNKGGTFNVVNKVQKLGKDLVIYNPSNGQFIKQLTA